MAKVTTIDTNKSSGPEELIGSWALLDENGKLLKDFSYDYDKKQDPASVTKIWTLYVILSMTFRVHSIRDDFFERHKDKLRSMIKDSQNVYALDLAALAVAEWRGDTELEGKLAALKQNNDPDNINRNEHERVIRKHIAEHPEIYRKGGKKDGTLYDFAWVMNQAAKKYGLKNSHFVTADGMNDPGHYSTAEDMARMQYLLVTDFPNAARITKYSSTTAIIGFDEETGKNLACVSGKGGTAVGSWGDGWRDKEGNKYGYSSLTCHTRNGYYLGIAGAMNHVARDAFVKKVITLSRGKKAPPEDLWEWLYSDNDTSRTSQYASLDHSFSHGLPSKQASENKRNGYISIS